MKRSKTVNVVLWVLLVVLGALFLFAGATKLGMPAPELASQPGLPAPFMQFIGIAEMAGGLGLLLPGPVRIHKELTPIAASGLIPIMVGAVVVSALRLHGCRGVPPVGRGAAGRRGP